MKNKLILILVSQLVTLSLSAQSFSGSIDGLSGILLSMNGLSHSWERLPDANDSGTMTVTVDPILKTLYLNSMNVITSPGTVTFSKDIVTSFGSPAKTITTSVTLNPTSLELENIGPHTFIQESGGNFRTIGYPTVAFQFFLSGNYNVSDGTTVHEGSFGVNIYDPALISNILLDVSSYPDHINLGMDGVSPWRYFEYKHVTLFEVDFDGSPIAISLERMSIQSGNNLILSQIPEVSSIGFIMGLLVLGVAFKARKSRRI